LKNKSFSSIRHRLTFWFLILTLAPLLSVLIITYFQRAKVIESRTIDKLSAIRDLKIVELNNWIENRISDLSILSGDNDIKSLGHTIDKKNRTKDDIVKIELARDHLLLNLNDNNYYDEIYIIGAKSGRVEISTDEKSIGLNKTEVSSFVSPMQTGQIFIRDIFKSSNGKESMAISKPIYCKHKNSHLSGILVVKINLQESLYRMLQNRVGLGDSGETLIVDKNVVALNDLRWYEHAPLNLQIYAQPAVLAAQGKIGVIKANDYRDEPVLAAYAHIPRMQWGFICKQDLNELNKPIRHLLSNIILLFFLTTFVIFIIVNWISRKIATPIIKLNSVTEMIRTGNYSIENAVQTNDEIGSLTISINDMASSISKRNIIQQSVGEISEFMVELIIGFGKEFS